MGTPRWARGAKERVQSMIEQGANSPASSGQTRRFNRLKSLDEIQQIEQVEDHPRQLQSAYNRLNAKGAEDYSIEKTQDNIDASRSAAARLNAKEEQTYNANKAEENTIRTPREEYQAHEIQRAASNDPTWSKNIDRGIDKFMLLSKPGQWINRFSQAGAKMSGISQEDMGFKADTGNKVANKALDISGTVSGLFIDPTMMNQLPASLQGVGTQLGGAFNKFFGRTKTLAPELEQQVSSRLALPEPKQRGNINRVQTPDVIYGTGNVHIPEPLALPQGNVVPKTRLKVAANNTVLDSVMKKIKPIVTERMTPPLENEKELAKWVQSHLGIDNISLNEVRKLPYEDLRQMAELMRGRLSVADEANKAASELGHNLDDLLNGKAPSIRDTVSKQATERAYGVYPELLPKVKAPQFSTQTMPENLASPVERVGRAQRMQQPNDMAAVSNSADNVQVPQIKDNQFEAITAKSTKEPQPIKIDEKVIEFNESGKGDANTFESKISRNKKKDRTPWSEKWQQLKTAFTEDIAPIHKLEKDIKGSIPSAEKSLYKSARLFKGVPEKIAKFIDNRLSPIVRQVEKAGYHSNDLGRYALAVHAKDVNSAGLKSGFTNAEIEDVINKFNTPEMEAARQQLVELNRELLDDLVSTGVVSAELRDVLNMRWKNYIPLFRDVEDVVAHNTGLSDALANVASPIKKLKGSEQNVIDPLENMVTNIMRNINAAERNKVASYIPELAKLDTEQRFIRKLDDSEKIDGKSVVSVKENGKNVHYEVEENVRDAILSLDKESANLFFRMWAQPASWLRAGATLTPEFQLRNPIRDYRNAKIVSESGFRLDDFAVGLASSIMGKFGKGRLYQDWIQHLGAYGNVASMDRKAFISAQRKVLTQSKKDMAINVINPKTYLKLLREISDVSESATKVGEYRAALRSGATKQEAAYRARDLMDFARAGYATRNINRVVAFLNANIQGKSKLIRSFKQDKWGTTYRAFKAVTVPTIGVYVWNKNMANDKQRETIDNSPEWLKFTFWQIAIPGTDVVARIPKPFDFAIFANAPERAMDYLFDNDKGAFDGFAQSFIADNAVLPQMSGILPLIEGMANYSFFRGNDIIPFDKKDLKPEDQYDPIRTSETAKGIAKGVDTVLGKMGGNFRSPYIVDNTIQGLFAGGGRYATNAIDSIVGHKSAVDSPKAPSKKIEQRPVISAFLVDPDQGGERSKLFYDTLDGLKKEKNSASVNKTPLDSKKQRLIAVFNAANDNVALFNKRIKDIEKDKTKSAKDKQKEIDDLRKRKNNLMDNAVKQLKV